MEHIKLHGHPVLVLLLNKLRVPHPTPFHYNCAVCDNHDAGEFGDQKIVLTQICGIYCFWKL